MALQKQNLSLPFAVSLDTKTDPFQIGFDKMLSIVNATYSADKKLTKRNGYADTSSLPEGANATLLTTFNNNLTAVGNNFYTYSEDGVVWLNKGLYQPVALSVIPVVRSSLSQSRVDITVHSSSVSAAVYLDSDGDYKYEIFDATTSQVFVNPTALPSGALSVRCFSLGNHFVFTFLINDGGARLKYISVPLNNLNNPTPATTISISVASTTTGYDGFVRDGNLYIAWTSASGEIRKTRIDSFLNQSNTAVTAGFNADRMSVYVDESSQMWISFYDDGSTDIYVMVANGSLNTILSPQLIDTGNTINVITSAVVNDVVTVLYDVVNQYSYTSIDTFFIRSNTCTVGGIIGTPTDVVRSVGLASKAFVVNDKIYLLTVQDSSLQPTYFLITSEGDAVAKLAYSNAGGYMDSQVLPGISLQDTVALVGYQFKDLLVSVNKDINSTNPSSLYTQTGLNLASFDLKSQKIVSAEIANNLHLTGGFLWMYDGNASCEHNFHLWPEDVEATAQNSGGSMSEQQYYYQVTYEWTDAQGNIHRSAPSQSIGVLLGSGEDSVELNIPTLRLTYKDGVRIVIYRWSTAQQNFYQVTSITSPLMNDPSVDSVVYNDDLADSSILGNSLIYTTGGVVENIAAPACNTLSLYKSRLMVLSAENPNTTWYSKQVVQGVPVEPSDLLTIYVAPSIGVQGSTGIIKTMATLDDKFIFFKSNAAYYITGNGPDSTGANNDFSEPIFITATVGCDNQQSIASVPQGLVFQAGTKGIWLLGRDLSTSYTGNDVEAFNNDRVTSVVNPPGTNELRFCLDNNQALLYDYYYDRWGTFNHIPSVSSTLLGSLHTYLREDGLVRIETPGKYLDGSQPVLMSFKTAWYNFAGLQGYERFYFLYIIGQFYSANKLYVTLAYDYNESPTQSVLIKANNSSPAYGNTPYYGDGSPYGGPWPIEQWRIFAQRQRCQAFQIVVNEVYDGDDAIQGQGLSFSGLNLVYGLKKGFKPIAANISAG